MPPSLCSGTAQGAPGRPASVPEPASARADIRAGTVAALGRWRPRGACRSAGPTSAQGPAEGPDVVREQVRDLHRGEMAAPVVLRPVLDLAERIHQRSDRGVRREDSDPGWRTGLPLLGHTRLLLRGEGPPGLHPLIDREGDRRAGPREPA